MITYIITCVLIICIIYILNNKSNNKREALDKCEVTNCGDIQSESRCLECDNCGIYTDRRNYKYCVNGNNTGPLFIKNWKIWKYLENEPLYNINSPSIKLYNEYYKYLEDYDKIIKNTPMPKYNYIK